MTRTTKMTKSYAAALAASLALGTAAPAFADPPSWAPAHGWRAKQKQISYRAPSAVVLVPTTTYATVACDRSMLADNAVLIGRVLGGAAGAVAGAQFGQGTGKLAATAGGTLIGALLGGEIAGAVAAPDAACAQYALTAAQTDQTVTWTNPDDGRTYEVTPERDFTAFGTAQCREYTSRAVIDRAETTTRGTACRQPDGQWKIVH